MTGTPAVSRYSTVLSISKNGFGPEHTTATFVRPSSIKSAEMSIEFAAALWTPPMPPVAKILIPAMWARTIVPATVVPPLCRPRPVIYGRSRRETFMVDFDPLPNASIMVLDNPTLARPLTIPMVAGTAPFARMTSSTCIASSTLSGEGNPAPNHG